MEQVTCSCTKCGRDLGEFANIWTQIGKSYVSPVGGDDGNAKVENRGSVRVGDKETLVGDW